MDNQTTLFDDIAKLAKQYALPGLNLDASDQGEVT
jgi:hypothetical protein